MKAQIAKILESKMRDVKFVNGTIHCVFDMDSAVDEMKRYIEDREGDKYIFMESAMGNMLEIIRDWQEVTAINPISKL